MKWTERLIHIKTLTFVMACAAGSEHFVETHQDILPGAGAGVAPNFSPSATLFSRSPQDRDGCKASSERLSIGTFDRTQEWRILKQELRWKEDGQIRVRGQKCRTDRHPVVICQPDGNLPIRRYRNVIKSTDTCFQQRIRCLRCFTRMKVLS